MAYRMQHLRQVGANSSKTKRSWLHWLMLALTLVLGSLVYALIQAPKQFVRIAGAGHNNLGANAVAAAKQFIAEE